VTSQPHIAPTSVAGGHVTVDETDPFKHVKVMGQQVAGQGARSEAANSSTIASRTGSPRAACTAARCSIDPSTATTL
jgi:hypothetical protein